MSTINMMIAMAIFTAVAAAAIYWWSEAQYSRMQLQQIEMRETNPEPTKDEIMAANLNNLAKSLTTLEGGKDNMTIAQAKDFIAALGQHWRQSLPEVAAAEFAAILERAGKKSA